MQGVWPEGRNPTTCTRGMHFNPHTGKPNNTNKPTILQWPNNYQPNSQQTNNPIKTIYGWEQAEPATTEHGGLELPPGNTHAKRKKKAKGGGGAEVDRNWWLEWFCTTGLVNHVRQEGCHMLTKQGPHARQNVSGRLLSEVNTVQVRTDPTPGTATVPGYLSDQVSCRIHYNKWLNKSLRILVPSILRNNTNVRSDNG